MDRAITQTYGNKVRVRGCGILWKNDSILLVNHKFSPESSFWAPPGGGVEFGQSLSETISREFMEETQMAVKVGAFLFGCEYINDPLHSVELFFHTEFLSGEVKVGQDPELPIIQDVCFMEYAKLKELKAKELHGIFEIASTAEQFRELRGFYRI